MDIFERKEVSNHKSSVFIQFFLKTIKFTQLLRVKLRQQREGKKPLEPI